MKVKEKISKRKAEGFGDEIEFTFKQSAKAFQILVARLYKYPIKAIIRELSCNGHDSHIEAGCPERQMLIHLPNRTEPYFSIRDYGTGISEEDVLNIYTKVFESTKTDSNEYTGCLGLGSKTPFSYTKNFIVTSYYQGKIYTYNAYFNEDGKPCMAPLANSGGATTEENGVEIKISVKSQDNETWRSYAEEVYEYFAVTPKVVGAKIEVKKPDYIMEGSNWKLRKSQWGTTSGLKIVMGNVAYPVKGLSDDSLDQTHYSIINSNIDLFVNIGDVEMEASREGLHFDERTINSLRTKMDAMIAESKKTISKTFDKCLSLWDARCKYNDLVDRFPSEIIKAIGVKNITFKGSQLFNSMNHSRIHLSNDCENEFYQIKADNSWRANGKVKRKKKVTVIASDEIKFYINDLKTGSYTRSVKYVEANGGEMILCKFDDIAERKTFMENTGILESDWNYTSSLPKPASVSRKGRKKTTKICRFSGASSFISHCWENEDDVALEDGGYYVEVSRHRVVDRVNEKTTTQDPYDPTLNIESRRVKMGEVKHEVDPSQLQVVLDGLKICGYELPVVYGVKTSLMKKLKKSGGNWINVMDMARIKIPKFMGTFNTTQHIYNDRALHKMDKELNCYLHMFKKVRKIISPDSEVHNVFKRRSSLRLSEIYKTKCKTLKNAYRYLFKRSHKEEAVENGIVDYAKSIHSRYILLNEMGIWLDNDCLEHVALYIDAVDNKEKV
jgi:hypothetical protein